jgi:hypothetical protein
VSTAAPAPLHPDLEPVAWLVGTWRGEGSGDYDTIEPFAYLEELRFEHFGKPVLAYAQKTWSPADGAPMHSEVGFWRLQPGGKVEVVLAHPFGAAEVLEGAVEGHSITLASEAVAATSTAKEIAQVARAFALKGDTLSYRVDMAAVGRPLQPHLRGELHRAT